MKDRHPFTKKKKRGGIYLLIDDIVTSILQKSSRLRLAVRALCACACVVRSPPPNDISHERVGPRARGTAWWGASYALLTPVHMILSTESTSTYVHNKYGF